MKISPFGCVPFLCVGVCMHILGIDSNCEKTSFFYNVPV